MLAISFVQIFKCASRRRHASRALSAITLGLCVSVSVYSCQGVGGVWQQCTCQPSPLDGLGLALGSSTRSWVLVLRVGPLPSKAGGSTIGAHTRLHPTRTSLVLPWAVLLDPMHECAEKDPRCLQRGRGIIGTTASSPSQ